MPLKTIVVYESDGEWTRGIRRFISPEIDVVECPSSPLVIPSEAHCPWASLLVVPPDRDAAQILEWSESVITDRPDGLHMAVVRPSSDELAWCLREIGSQAIWDEFWQVPQMARVIERFWHQVAMPDLSLRQRIWNNLPWDDTDRL